MVGLGVFKWVVVEECRWMEGTNFKWLEVWNLDG